MLGKFRNVCALLLFLPVAPQREPQRFSVSKRCFNNLKDDIPWIKVVGLFTLIIKSHMV